MILRLRCTCGRNLADVTYNEHNPDFTADRLDVTRRPGVGGGSYRPWAEGHPEADWHDRTYTFRCPGRPGQPCGQVHVRRHERISEAWNARASMTGVVIAIIGADL